MDSVVVSPGGVSVLGVPGVPWPEFSGFVSLSLGSPVSVSLPPEGDDDEFMGEVESSVDVVGLVPVASAGSAGFVTGAVDGEPGVFELTAISGLEPPERRIAARTPPTTKSNRATPPPASPRIRPFDIPFFCGGCGWPKACPCHAGWAPVPNPACGAASGSVPKPPIPSSCGAANGSIGWEAAASSAPRSSRPPLAGAGI